MWKRISVVTVVALAACSSASERIPSPSPEMLRTPAPVQITASEYWDAHPADLHNLCASLTVFANFVGWPNEMAYRTYRKSWSRKDYDRGETDPSAPDAFAEAVSRCGL